MTFNPSDVGMKGSLFGFPYSADEADLVILPVPWDVTTSFSDGTAQAPEIIFQESLQLDFSLRTVDKAFNYPIAMLPISNEVLKKSKENRPFAIEVIAGLEEGKEIDHGLLRKVNESSEWMINKVRGTTNDWISKGKVVGCLGGDHSTPLGLIQALTDSNSEFGVLQIDAHMDLREAYEGFTYSHASIMFNALRELSVTKLVQVGVRDFCEEELEFQVENKERVITYFDEDIQKNKWNERPWPTQAAEIIEHLPEQVYISFDMDGLDPFLCPNTGTPVPGGLSFYEAVYLIEEVARSGRKIIGFDISECGPSTWDANVASRVLYRLASCVGMSRGFLRFT